MSDEQKHDFGHYQKNFFKSSKFPDRGQFTDGTSVHTEVMTSPFPDVTMLDRTWLHQIQNSGLLPWYLLIRIS